MSKFHSYLNTATTIITQYDGAEPLAASLKKFFALSKKYGSKDRKEIGHLCYSYYRLGKTLRDVPVDARIVIALYLTSSTPLLLLHELFPQYNETIGRSLAEKVVIVQTEHEQFSLEEIFPWHAFLSPGIDPFLFNQSFLVQPDLFLRLRPGYEDIIPERLKAAGYESMQKHGSTCLQLPSSSKLDDLVKMNKEAVIQDRSSQRIAEFIQHIDTSPRQLKVWDCCAASGGKSILAVDILKNIELTVTDVRETILYNLRRRFEEAGIKSYTAAVRDLTSQDREWRNIKYDVIICDAPCSGSGTWSRTPEQLFYFEEKKIEYYADLQKAIVQNSISQLMNGGHFLYITCSVFRQENEEIVEFITRHGLKLIKSEVLKGYSEKADTLFAALFIASR